MGILYGEDAGVDRNVPIDELNSLNRDNVAGNNWQKGLLLGQN